MADWIGVPPDYVYGELLDGRMPYENISRVAPRKEYRVRLSDFVRYLKAHGYTNLPVAEDFL